METDRRRETTATSKDELLAKAPDVVGCLAQGRPTDWAQAKGEALVAHYLDPTRRPVWGRAWSLRHREEQQVYCTRFVCPVIADVELSRLSRMPFARILAQAPTAPVAAHLRRCCSPWWPPGWSRGLLLARQDVLRGVRWSPPAGQVPADDDTAGHFIDEAGGRWAWSFTRFAPCSPPGHWPSPAPVSRTCPACWAASPCGSPRTSTFRLTGTPTSSSTGPRRRARFASLPTVTACR